MNRWIVVVAVVLLLILLPFGLFGEWLDGWTVDTIGDSSTFAVVVTLVVSLLAADVLLPVPSSVVSVLGGALLGFAAGMISSFVGMTLGCLVGYGLGRSGGRQALHRFVGEKELRRLDDLGDRFGSGTLIAARPLPVLAEASTVFAGMAAIPIVRFLIPVTFANLGVSMAYSAVGAYAVTTQSFLLAVAGAWGLPAAAWLVARRSSRGAGPSRL